MIKKIEPDFNLVECFSTDLLISPKPDSNNSVVNVGSSDEKAINKDLSLILIDEAVNNATSGCVISPVCQLKQVFFEALTAFISVLERYTLADIISNESELAELLFYRNPVAQVLK